jgi:hypothetical protein
MNKIKFSVIDAFTNTPFTGNPAACVLTAEPLDEKTMQNIAMEMNLSETAFTVPLKNKKNEFQLRWFTPTREVPLCGHATLAMAHHLKSISDKSTEFLFHTLSGALAVTFDKEEITMDFPSAPLNLITDDVQELNDWLESILLTDEFKILGTANQYLFVELKDWFVEGLVPISELGSDYFEYIEERHMIRGKRTGRKFKLAETIRVTVLRADVEAGFIDFGLAEELPAAAQKSKKSDISEKLEEKEEFDAWRESRKPKEISRPGVARPGKEFRSSRSHGVVLGRENDARRPAPIKGPGGPAAFLKRVQSQPAQEDSERSGGPHPRHDRRDKKSDRRQKKRR